LVIIALFSCTSAPDEAALQILAKAQESMENARKKARDFGGPDYASEEWNATETIYNTARTLQPATMQEYEAALLSLQNTTVGYDNVFQKAIPQYAEARKNAIQTARNNAVNAGAETYEADLLEAADQKDKDSLVLFDQKDYYGYQKASLDAENLYGIIAVEAEGLSIKQEIEANKLARFDPDTYAAADQSVEAVKTAYDAQDMEGMKTAANDALTKYQQVLNNGWQGYAGEGKQLADNARTNAIAVHADTALKDDFAKAETVYNQGNDDFSAGNFKQSVGSFNDAQKLYAALSVAAAKQQKDATAALQAAQKKVADSQAKAKAVPGTENNDNLKKALGNIADAQQRIANGDYPGAILAAAEAQKNAGLSDDYVAQAQKAKAAKDALAAAKAQMDGVPNDARAKYAAQYKTATDAYADGVKAQNAQDWNTVTADAKKITDAVAAINKAKLADDAAEKKAADAAAAALAAAKKRIDGVGADNQKSYATQYKSATDAYADGVKAQNAKDWNTVNADVKKINDALDQMDKAIAAAEAQKKAEEAAKAAAEKKAADAAAAALAAAKARLDWATNIGAAQQYPVPYNQAQSAYNDGVEAQSAKDWDKTKASANTVISIVDGIEQQKRSEANDAMATAKERLDWAAGENAATNYPENYAQADAAYTNGENALNAKDWNGAILAADAVMNALALVMERAPLPSQYTVRTWTGERDCLWNIAGRAWVYNDPLQWTRLYEANRDKLPNASNADDIDIGTVLDIPSLNGEPRQGMWDENKEYQPLPPR
jgi:hypothetical protein